MLKEEILSEIDNTLDSLIKNAAVLSYVEEDDLSSLEKDSFQKTQESLLARLIHMDEMLQRKREEAKIPNKRLSIFKIQEKLLRFSTLSDENANLSLGLLGWKKVKRIKIRKNRKKVPFLKT